jgi:hypothetical protein
MATGTVYSKSQVDTLLANTPTAKSTVAAATTTQTLAANTIYDITGVAGQTTTFTLPTATLGQQITILLRQPTSGSAAGWAFPAATHWPNGQLPVLSLLNKAEDLITLFAMGNGAWLGVFGATNSGVVAPPNPPVGVSATAASGQVALAWSAASPGGAPLTGYAILRSTTSGAEAQIATAAATASTYTDTTVTNGTTYYYKIAAVTAVGQAASSEVTAAPQAPVGYADSTSGNRSLTILGSVTSVTSPLSGAGNAAQFNGTTGYLSAGNVQSALGIGGANPFTIEGWVKRGRTATTETFIGAYTQSGARQLAYIINSSNQLQAFVWNSAGANQNVLSPGLISDTTTAHHIAIVWDGTSLYICFDGTSTKTSLGAITGGVNPSYTGPLLLGADNNGTNNSVFSFAQATFDEFRVSSSARYTASSYTVPTAPLSVDANTTALWHLDTQA